MAGSTTATGSNRTSRNTAVIGRFKPPARPAGGTGTTMKGAPGGRVKCRVSLDAANKAWVDKRAQRMGCDVSDVMNASVVALKAQVRTDERSAREAKAAASAAAAPMPV